MKSVSFQEFFHGVKIISDLQEIERGATCLAAYNKNYDANWSVRFFILLLDSWKVWSSDLARGGSQEKNEILKRYTSLVNMGIHFPSKPSYYNYIQEKKKLAR
jgi:hypothetical protein